MTSPALELSTASASKQFYDKQRETDREEEIKGFRHNCATEGDWRLGRFLLPRLFFYLSLALEVHVLFVYNRTPLFSFPIHAWDGQSEDTCASSCIVRVDHERGFMHLPSFWHWQFAFPP